MVFGLLGFFFLSESIFGDSGPSRIRPLLPGIAFGLYAAIGLGSGWSFNLLRVFLTHAAPPTVSPIVVAIGVLANALIGYIGGYMAPRLKRNTVKVLVNLALAIVLLTFLSSVTVIYFYTDTAEWAGIATLVGAAVYFAVDIDLTVFIFYPIFSRSKNQVVKNIGIIATILAILAQFLPPVLDLLNIPITKP